MEVLGIYLERLPDEIADLTMYAFGRYLNQLGKKVNWDFQMAALPGGSKPDEKWHPFTPTIQRQKEIRKATQGSLEDFINNINNSNRGR